MLAQEFKWLPSEIKKEDSKDIESIMTILSTFNTVRNKEMEKINRKNK